MSFHRAAPFLSLCAALLVAACAGTPPPQRSSQPDSYTKDEGSFAPGRYRTLGDSASAARQNEPPVSHDAQTPARNERAVRVMGFKVQVLSSTELGEVERVRDSLRVAFPQEGVDITFDAPRYKLRVGNCADRAAAEELRRLLFEQGWSQAWIVPDMVLRNR